MEETMNNTYKKGIVAASVALFASSFIACGDSSVQAPDVSGVTVDPAGIADNSDIQSSSSMLVIEPSSSSNTTIEPTSSSSNIIELSSSSEYIPEISSSSIKTEPVTPPVACKPAYINGVISYTGCVHGGDIEWSGFGEDNMKFTDFGPEGGNWFTRTDSLEGGDSKLIWDVGDSPDTTKDVYSQSIIENSGLKGEAKLGTAYEYAYANFGFGLGAPIKGSTDKFQSIDASNWTTICVDYKSTAGLSIVLTPSESLNTITEGNNYKASLPKTSRNYECISIEAKFKQETGWGNKVPLEDFLKNLSAVEFHFTLSSEFTIYGIYIDLK